MCGIVLCRNHIIAHGEGVVNYTGSSTSRQALEPFVMPVYGHKVGTKSAASYYYSIKIRRGAALARPLSSDTRRG